MTTRRSLSRTLRARVFDAANGLCHICGGKITASDAWDVEHRLPLALGGADDETNMSPAHKVCHRAKSADDIGRIRKADRQKAVLLGTKKRPTMPGSRTSKWKRKLNGEVVLR